MDHKYNTEIFQAYVSTNVQFEYVGLLKTSDPRTRTIFRNDVIKNEIIELMERGEFKFVNR